MLSRHAWVCPRAPRLSGTRTTPLHAVARVPVAARRAGHRRIARSRLDVRANYDAFSTDLLGPQFHNRARISDEMMQELMELPGTTGLNELRSRAEALTTWKLALGRGVLPAAEEVDWPQEPFKSKFMDALSNLEMARFTRRYPAVLETLMKQMLMLVKDFEQKLLEAESRKEAAKQQRPPPQQNQQQQQQQQRNDEDGEQEQGEGEDGGEDGQQEQQLSQEQLEQALEQAAQGAAQGKEGREIKITLESAEGQQDKKVQADPRDPEFEKAVAEAAESVIKQWEQEMEQVMDNLEKAQTAFDDLAGRMEIRPAAELGPIILCLDTSGSMRGAREVVAKALALECMRGAHRQQRPCYLYAFSGPDQVQELELSVDLKSLNKLLEFLACDFHGGTDVDKPLQLSLDRLKKAEWCQADILMVTDGEINPPSQDLLDALSAAHEDMGLEVHGLLVSSRASDAMAALCTHLHLFKSWTAVGAEAWQYQ
ncbi:MAG: hypothetical protein J3K34DRAFT_454053 [Monoraphidium minutum]|nr:MAG: hypothetical protein J3K34DRAFT_454053 [Monoraphidium minutum]